MYSLILHQRWAPTLTAVQTLSADAPIFSKQNEELMLLDKIVYNHNLSKFVNLSLHIQETSVLSLHPDAVLAVNFNPRFDRSWVFTQQ